MGSATSMWMQVCLQLPCAALQQPAWLLEFAVLSYSHHGCILPKQSAKRLCVWLIACVHTVLQRPGHTIVRPGRQQVDLVAPASGLAVQLLLAGPVLQLLTWTRPSRLLSMPRSTTQQHAMQWRRCGTPTATTAQNTRPAATRSLPKNAPAALPSCLVCMEAPK